MSGAYPPLTCKDVKRILKNMGFHPRPQKGTSREQWVRHIDGKFYKVTVDRPKSPFGHDLVASMAKQAGVSRKAFYEALNNPLR